jgi:hypothetical protein
MTTPYEQMKRLAREIGADAADLLALGIDNDPNYTGSPKQVAMAEWFAELWEARGFVGRGGVHLRRAHYQILGSPKHNGNAIREHQERLELPDQRLQVRSHPRAR